MSRRLLRVLVLQLVLAAAAARAEDVYVWTDASGETHYTNDLASIPDKARRTVRKLEPNLWEVRVDLKDGIARVLFTVTQCDAMPAMVLLHGFIKKSQHLPAADLALARSRMKEVRHG